MKSSISEIAQNLISKIFKKFDVLRNKKFKYGSVIVEEVNNKSKVSVIEKDNIKIVLGETIEIYDNNKYTKISGLNNSIEISGFTNVTINGNVNIEGSGVIISKVPIIGTTGNI